MCSSHKILMAYSPLRSCSKASSQLLEVLLHCPLPQQLHLKTFVFQDSNNHLSTLLLPMQDPLCRQPWSFTFRQPCRYELRDRRSIVANLEYVGNLEEIIELNYRGHCTVVLLCSSVRENYRGDHATMKKDKYGFTIANFAKKIPIGPESFAFPMYIDQVFFHRTHKIQVGRLFYEKKYVHRG